MEEKFFERIGYDGKLEDISRKICSDFGMGEVLENKIVMIGYEDFNFILKTEKGNYFIKIFEKSRPDKECERIVNINKVAMENGVAVPKLFKLNEKYFHRMEINKLNLRFCVFEYIDGENLFSLKHRLNENEIRFLSRQIALINSLNMKPDFVYDNWAVVNFFKEFKKREKYLEKKDHEVLDELIEKFKKIDLDKLPHCFVHGDILSQNIMKDKNGELRIIDFSVSNYYPRIQELAVLACEILFDENNDKKSEKNLEIALEEYQKIIKLTDDEIGLLPLYIKFAHAMHVLLTSYEKIVNKNNSQENEFFLRIGRAGLKINS